MATRLVRRRRRLSGGTTRSMQPAGLAVELGRVAVGRQRGRRGGPGARRRDRPDVGDAPGAPAGVSGEEPSPAVPERIRPSRTHRPGAGRSSSQSPLQDQVTTRNATGKTSIPQAGSIADLGPGRSRRRRGPARARARRAPAVIPRGIAIPQSTATAKPSGRPRAIMVQCSTAAGPPGFWTTRYASGPQISARPKHQAASFASQTSPGRARDGRGTGRSAAGSPGRRR